jgi:ferredoxin
MGVIEKGKSQGLDNATAKVLQRVSAEPAYRVVLYKILAFCESARSYPEIWHEISAYSEMKTALHPPQALLSWLVQAGGIEQVGVLRITCDASGCVACKLCIDVCRHHAVSLYPQDEGIAHSVRAVVFERQMNADLLAPTEDKMSHLLCVSLYRT